MEVDECGDTTSARTVEEVQFKIQHAKLDESQLKPLSQVITFSNELLGPDVKLIQVSKDMANSLKEGQVLTLRGEEEEDAVLCTRDKTYNIKEAEQSNSLLILPELTIAKDIEEEGERHLASRTVSGVMYNYFELQEIRPRLDKLRLELKSLTEAHVREGTGGGSTKCRLLNVIQASEKELDLGLKAFEAVTFKGGWFALDQEYKMNVLSFILRFFEENSWPLDCVRKQETVDTLKDLADESILGQVFDIYCYPMTGGQPDEYSLDTTKVSRFYGDYLLVSVFTVDEFLHIWCKAVPEGVTTDINHLRGLAFIDDSAKPHKIRRFCEYDLPTNVHERLDILFRTREKWSVDDITPYVETLTTPKLNVNALLAKYARPVNVNGKKLFCAKHGK